MPAPVPPNEQQRLAALRELDVLDTQPDQTLDQLVALAAQIFDVPIALISLVDEDRQWFKAKLGLEVSETPRDLAFCAHTILEDGILEVENATNDPRFRLNSLVTDDPGIRYYAGAPLTIEGGHRIGTLCVIDRRPRRLSDREKETLTVLARAVSAQLALDSAMKRARAESEERGRVETRLRFTTDLLQAMHGIESEVLTGLELPAAFDRVLKTLLEVTESEYGFIGEILSALDGQPYLKTHAITNIAWNDETRRFYEENAPQGMEFLNLRTLFGAVMTTGEPVISNDPAKDSRRGGLPSGHPPLRCFLGVPFTSGGRTTGMIGIANAPNGYDVNVVEMLQPLLGACASMVGFSRLERSRRLAEAALRESRERYRLVLENSLDALIGIDADGLVQSWGRQAEAIFGWREDEVNGRDLGELIVPDRQRAAHRHGMQRYLTTGESRVIGRRVELRALRRSGEEFPVELTISAIHGDEETSFSAFVRDISDRIEAEEELRGTTSRLMALIRNLGAGLMVEDESRKIILANKKLCSMFGLPIDPEAMIGADCGDSAAALAELFDDPEGFLADIGATLEQRELVRGYELHLKDGRILERDFIPIFAGEGFLGTMWQYRDVTERKHSERELLERGNELSAANSELSRASRLKDEFLASMSHELRTPLNAVLGLSEGLRGGVFGEVTPLQSDQIAIIEDSGQHLLELINDVLDLSKVEAGKLHLSVESVSVESICQTSLRMIREAAHKKELRVATSFDSRFVTLEADPLRLKQILVNLLGNAVKFTPAGGTIGLETSCDFEAEEAEFVVWDTGMGIDPDDLPKLFKPFVQLDSSLTRRHSGSGLGLSLVRQLSELHGGGVGVESEPAKGSRFSVTLPYRASALADLESDEAAQGMVSASEVRSPVAPHSEGPLVLLAEDHEINVRTVSSYLESHGCRVAIARNGREAIDRTLEERPDVVLMDIQMPIMDGLTAIGVMRDDARMSSVPIVALTALAMAGDRERCLRAGADEYMSKPVRLRQLLGLIHRLTTPDPDPESAS